jgi:hypothetical protein
MQRLRELEAARLRERSDIFDQLFARGSTPIAAAPPPEVATSTVPESPTLGGVIQDILYKFAAGRKWETYKKHLTVLSTFRDNLHHAYRVSSSICGLLLPCAARMRLFLRRSHVSTGSRHCSGAEHSPRRGRPLSVGKKPPACFTHKKTAPRERRRFSEQRKLCCLASAAKNQRAEGSEKQGQ